MRVKPAPGLKVRDPHTKKLLPDDGIDVPDDSPVWNRILNDGDVVRVELPATAEPTSARAETEGDNA
ncbi:MULTISPECIES: DUF2635 domain-containing protein [Burkholderia cepacia complex]|uniref:DUF2635 domain-containing protein n=1 Tax=Burkholderia cepacia complex TaxID=87882 RepID=UPI00078B798E|nr:MULTISPECIES: DUF2635 domain-containing protein [Burkholderia cepacia complex]AMU15139.1 hypothetical protein A3203_19525 [Burkholderia cenocepacia]MBU9550407.1 DUF2635 domain-containing protein [Burkholderia multivorans]MEB2544076.1 DUF2635 domain-containing protein [Burkholderia cenocepacia]DAH71606.1 MAG TPA: Protein of unknown function (DUF2635) [Caudoviricetes sp.]